MGRLLRAKGSSEEVRRMVVTVRETPLWHVVVHHNSTVRNTPEHTRPKLACRPQGCTLQSFTSASFTLPSQPIASGCRQAGARWWLSSSTQCNTRDKEETAIDDGAPLLSTHTRTVVGHARVHNVGNGAVHRDVDAVIDKIRWALIWCSS